MSSPLNRRGLALSELLLVVVTVAVIFGLIVSLARRVRRESAHDLAERVLVELEFSLAAYQRREQKLPDVAALLPGSSTLLPTPPLDTALSAAMPNEAPPESALRIRALVNNRQVVRALAVGRGNRAEVEESVLDTLGVLLFDGGTLRDPWGAPIAYMAGGSSLIGTAAGDRPFFFSAGPDGQYLTREDNVYSYEIIGRAAMEGLDDTDAD